MHVFVCGGGVDVGGCRCGCGCGCVRVFVFELGGGYLCVAPAPISDSSL